LQDQFERRVETTGRAEEVEHSRRQPVVPARLVKSHYRDIHRLSGVSRGEPVEFSEVERVRKDGKRIHLALSVSPIRDGSGKVVGAASVKRDITEHKRMQAALEAESARSRELAEALEVAQAFVWELDGQITYWSSGATRLYGFTAAEAIGRALKALKASRIAMATPYSEEVIGRARRYYETKYGIAVVASESLGADNAYAIGKMDAGVAEAAFRRIDGPGIDALVVPGGNFPTMDWIAAWERQFGKPVITTNQAALWAVLQTMKFDMPLPGKGRLLEQLPAG